MSAVGVRGQIRKCRTIKPYETQHRLKYEGPRGHHASTTLRKHSTTTIRCLSCTEREAVKDPKRSAISFPLARNKRSVRDREPLVSLVYGRKWIIPASFVTETSMRARDKDNFRWRSVPPEDRMGDSSAAVSCHAVMYVSGVLARPTGGRPVMDCPSCCVRVLQWSGKISRKQIENLRSVLR
ncbi:hypothetical protein QR685DRAFT_569554 [Neurospora intermedia]|uniref:Uncharacterized protein n=1 Tax=Neurospora intermedia TaxID=5142 RepID=A0ABR3DLE1_NEUIN